ncbi:MAG: cytochrome C oxidase subunit IV family protein [Bacteroidota bacterium]
MQHDTTSEVTFHHHTDDAEFKRRVRSTTILLSVITIIELGLGLLMYATDFPGWLTLFIKGMIVILTLAKAYYIVSVFMHLGDEIRNMIMTIVVPLLLFVWFIAAFLWDGSSFRNNRNTYDLYKKEKTMERPKHNEKTDTTTKGFGG